MLLDQRRDSILNIVESKGFVSLQEIVDLVGVSESTVRRDLEQLERIGQIRRTRGGAAYVGESLTTFDERRGRALAEKQRIGKRAAELIGSGETILLDGGTTTLEVARNLAGKSLQVVTNSLPIVNLLVGFHLSRAETRYAWIVAASVPVQVVLLSIVPGSLEDFIWANVAVGLGLIAAHELSVQSSLPALRTGLRHMLGGIRMAREVVVEALLVLLGATAVVTVLFWPIVSGIGSTVISPQAGASRTMQWSRWMLGCAS